MEFSSRMTLRSYFVKILYSIWSFDSSSLWPSRFEVEGFRFEVEVFRFEVEVFSVSFPAGFQI